MSVSTILLTVLGFVVGLALSFRSSTAYERLVALSGNIIFLALTLVDILMVEKPGQPSAFRVEILLDISGYTLMRGPVTKKKISSLKCQL